MNGSPIKEARLLAGQTVGLGDVELFVESTEANVVIPEYERPRPKPPVVLPTGAMICPRHTQAEAKYKCADSLPRDHGAENASMCCGGKVAARCFFARYAAINAS